MKKWAGLVVLGALALGGCDKPEIKICEDFILNKLRSPSTYKRIKASGIKVGEKYSVTVEYDAANAYGAPIRDNQICVFGLKDGRPDTTKTYDFDRDFSGIGGDHDDVQVSIDGMDAELDAAAQRMSNEK
ncbi:hypothetical protein [Sphingomonas sp. LaA6.9]|uniref:hypothetical protein n=1 Tax=Sphingomonas sp. LaA6.9 TaxID=2919914 RepID=UPI001F4F9C5C|nr:hypothetical protein [Sphingomonas sp. LaA6.9]MCJ8158353.1 hypothetical protein [Sphingomonas sp. LaA6.9]